MHDHEQLRQEATSLTRELTRIYNKVQRHNAQIEGLEKSAQRLDAYTLHMKRRLQLAMRAVRSDNRNSVIVCMGAIVVFLVIYLL